MGGLTKTALASRIACGTLFEIGHTNARFCPYSCHHCFLRLSVCGHKAVASVMVQGRANLRCSSRVAKRRGDRLSDEEEGSQALSLPCLLILSQTGPVACVPRLARFAAN